METIVNVVCLVIASQVLFLLIWSRVMGLHRDEEEEMEEARENFEAMQKAKERMAKFQK